MIDLKAGEYWVKAKGLTGWKTCSITVDGTFHMFGTIIDPHTIIEVGPRIPTPDEPWQCVPSNPTSEMMTAGAIYPDSYADMLAAAPKPT